MKTQNDKHAGDSNPLMSNVQTIVNVKTKLNEDQLEYHVTFEPQMTH